MEATMVSALSAAMGSLLAKLAGLLEKDLKLARGVKQDIVTLRDEMSTINAWLTELSQMEEPVDDLHRELRGKVRELAYDMEDCLDISMHRLGKPGFLSELKNLRMRSEIAKLIAGLKARVAELGNRHKLILQLPERPRAAVRVDPRVEARFQDAANLQGMDGQRNKLVELLQDGARQLKVVSILGFGGIGKTTLASQVYTAIQDKFDCTAFVSVSRTPNFSKIFSDISHQVRWVSTVRDDENRLISDLRHRLLGNRYLIVIDDVWTIAAWNTIKCCFVENNRGSRVITTTRIEDVAKLCCSGFPGCVYRMGPLNDVDSRILFHRTIFHSEDACPEHLKCVSNEILKKCGGLPLAILTIGGILACHQEIGSTEIWEKMIHSFSYFQLERSQAFEWLRHVFNLGFNDLSLELKTCLLYLGIFPEDNKIVKHDLLRRWIAEGFVTDKYGVIQEEIAESYFNELINRNMIQIAEFDDCGEVFSCRVHDLLLDYIILKCTEENFITIIKSKHSTKGPLDVRRLSLDVRNLESSDILENMALTQARSFNLWGPAQWLPSLTKFLLLRVLHLEIDKSRDEEYDMSCILSLFQLRYLRTSGIPCKKLPAQLCKLKQLKTLDIVSKEGYFVLDAHMLPSTFSHLILQGGVKLAGGVGHLRNLLTHWSPPPRHLRRLHVLDCLFSTVPAGWITQLKNLRSLEITVRTLPSDGIKDLAELAFLEHLKLHVKERVPREGVVTFHRAAFPNLREMWFRWEAPCLAFEAGTMPRLRSLVIDCYAKGARQADGVLDGIEHLGSLVELKVHVYERKGYISKYLCCGDIERPKVEEQRRWDERSLEAALKECILRVVIKTA